MKQTSVACRAVCQTLPYPLLPACTVAQQFPASCALSWRLRLHAQPELVAPATTSPVHDTMPDFTQSDILTKSAS